MAIIKKNTNLRKKMKLQHNKTNKLKKKILNSPYKNSNNLLILKKIINIIKKNKYILNYSDSKKKLKIYSIMFKVIRHFANKKILKQLKKKLITNIKKKKKIKVIDTYNQTNFLILNKFITYYYLRFIKKIILKKRKIKKNLKISIKKKFFYIKKQLLKKINKRIIKNNKLLFFRIFPYSTLSNLKYQSKLNFIHNMIISTFFYNRKFNKFINLKQMSFNKNRKKLLSLFFSKKKFIPLLKRVSKKLSGKKKPVEITVANTNVQDVLKFLSLYKSFIIIPSYFKKIKSQKNFNKALIKFYKRNSDKFEALKNPQTAFKQGRIFLNKASNAIKKRRIKQFKKLKKLKKKNLKISFPRSFYLFKSKKKKIPNLYHPLLEYIFPPELYIPFSFIRHLNSKRDQILEKEEEDYDIYFYDHDLDPKIISSKNSNLVHDYHINTSYQPPIKIQTFFKKRLNRRYARLQAKKKIRISKIVLYKGLFED